MDLGSIDWRDILARVKAGDAILDLGCCFAQDLRRLAADGAPTNNMFASDIIPDFWNLSYDLYQDKGTMKANFTVADILDAETTIKGKADVVLISLFLHIWNWDEQLEVAKTIVSLTKPGALIVAHQVGSLTSEEYQLKFRGNVAGVMYLHNVETTEKMWKQIGEETGVKFSVEASICSLTDWMLPEDCNVFGDKGVGLQYVVRRLDGSDGGQ